MTQTILNLSQPLLHMLPQNQHAQRVLELDQQKIELEAALNDKSGQLFQSKIRETIHSLQQEKELCTKTLNKSNGSYYQDSQSLLKKAWDKLVTAVLAALGICVETRDQLEPALQQVTLDQTIKNNKVAKTLIEGFISLEKKRDAAEQQLKRIIEIEKASLPTFETDRLSEKKKLEDRHLALCGKYFKDPSGLLEQAWLKCSSDPTALSTQFNPLEEDRKQIEAKLFNLNQQLSASSPTVRTYETLTIDSINKELGILEDLKKDESSLSGIDWKKTTIQASALATTLLGAGLRLI